MKRFVLYFIALRTIIAAFYSVNLIGPIRMTDIAGLLFPLVSIIYLMSSGSREKVARKGIVLVPLIWLILSSAYVVVVEEQLGFIYLYAKQIFRFANGVYAFIVFPRIFTNYSDVKQFAYASLIATVFPMAQIFAITVIGPGAFGLQVVNLEDVTLVKGVYGNYGVFATSTYIGLVALMILLADPGRKKSRDRYVALGFVSYIFMGLVTLSRILMSQIMSIVAIFVYAAGKRGSFGILAVFLLAMVIFSQTSLFESKTDELLARSEYEFDVLQGEKGYHYAMNGRVDRWDEGIEVFTNDYNTMDQLFGTKIRIGPHGDYFYWLFAYGWIGFLVFLRLTKDVTVTSLVAWRRYKDTSYRMFGAAVLSLAPIWILSAVGTTPSAMPDTLYLVFGLMGIVLNHDFREESDAST